MKTSNLGPVDYSFGVNNSCSRLPTYHLNVPVPVTRWWRPRNWMGTPGA